jgi:putative aldouronate transport system permease protein
MPIKKKSLITRIVMNWEYHLMVLMGISFAVIFSYFPMGGLVIAFKDYNFRDGIWGSAWVGFKNFKNLFGDFYMGNAITNTICLALLSTIISMPMTIFFALFINELSNLRFKRTVQTVSYLPHFISWVIMSVILRAMLSSSDGIINHVLMTLGIIDKSILFLGRADLYWWVVIIAGIWKELGWSAIVYLAIITGIDQTLYEAARVDGAGRLQRMWYITLPHLVGIISIMLILRMGSITGTGFEQAFFLSNALNYDRSNVLSYYVYMIGLRRSNFSYSTAIGLITSSVSAILMLTANWTSKKVSGRGIL